MIEIEKIPMPTNQPVYGQDFSPCKSCPFLFSDKDVCSAGCEALKKWQIKETYNNTDQVFFFDKQRAKRCQCGGLLIVEDGVTFCESCLKVVTRLSEQDMRKKVIKLTEKGYKRKVIADLIGFSLSKCRRICVEAGV